MFKSSEIVKILKEHGFILKRTNKHAIYSNGFFTVAVPLEKSLSKGLCRRIFQQAGLSKDIIATML